MIYWNEPDDSGNNVVRLLTREEAIEHSRKSFKYSRPNNVDPRTDEEALEDFIIIHWAWEAKGGDA